MEFWQSLALTEMDDLIELAKIAEEVGFAGITISDHLATPREIGTRYPYTENGKPMWEPDDPFPDPWVLIAAMAQETSRIRFMPIVTGHAPHFYGGITFYTGEVTAPLAALPERADGWKKGESLAYLVDFLDAQDRPVFRIYYQDAAAAAPLGFVAPSVLAQRRVDAAILCISLHELVSGVPTDLIRHLNPRTILLGHWEDIFQPVDQLPLKTVIFTDMPRAIQEIDQVMAGEEPDPPEGWNEDSKKKTKPKAESRAEDSAIGGPAEQS